MLKFIICQFSGSMILNDCRVYSVPRETVTAVRSDESRDYVAIGIKRTHACHHGGVRGVEVTVRGSKWRTLDGRYAVVVDDRLCTSIR